MILNEILKGINCHALHTIDSRYLRMHYMLNVLMMGILICTFEYVRSVRPRLTCLKKKSDSHINTEFVNEFCWDNLNALVNTFTGTETVLKGMRPMGGLLDLLYCFQTKLPTQLACSGTSNCCTWPARSSLSSPRSIENLIVKLTSVEGITRY